MDHTKVDQAGLNSPCQELFLRSLGFIVGAFYSKGVSLGHHIFFL